MVNNTKFIENINKFYRIKLIMLIWKYKYDNYPIVSI